MNIKGLLIAGLGGLVIGAFLIEGGMHPSLAMGLCLVWGMSVAVFTHAETNKIENS